MGASSVSKLLRGDDRTRRGTALVECVIYRRSRLEIASRLRGYRRRFLMLGMLYVSSLQENEGSDQHNEHRADD